MSKKYFRMMETPEDSWGPYRVDLETGERKAFDSHLDEMFYATPREGDYLVMDDDGLISVLRPTAFGRYQEIRYDEMPSLFVLMNDEVVVSTPEDVLEADWQLQVKIESLENTIYDMNEQLRTLEGKMYERRFFFPTLEARESRHLYNELKPMLVGLQAELEQAYEDMDKKVLWPLHERAWERKELSMKSVDDLIFGASSKGVSVLGQKKDFEI